MIFLPENDMQKKCPGQNDDRERYWPAYRARGSFSGRGAEVWAPALNWLSRGCRAIRGCGLPEALVPGVECGHQRWDNSHA